MKESQYLLDINEEQESFIQKDILFKYLRYWPWFLIAVLISLALGYLYMRYAPVTFKSVAKIKIIDDSNELDIATDAISVISGNPKINLDNEIEILKSYRLLSQVVADLNLDVSYHEIGNFKTTEIWNTPFAISKNISRDSLRKPLTYRVAIHSEEFVITDEEGKKFTAGLYPQHTSSSDFPFSIALLENIKISEYRDMEYKVILNPTKEATLKLARDLQVQATNKNSEILSLSLVGESIERSEAVLNAIIDKFNQDGILDRQLVSKRTVDFIEERFIYLSRELDSIEVGKQDFKQDNNLSYIEEDASFTLQRKSVNEEEVFNLQTQISLAKLLKGTVGNTNGYELLPADIGLEDSSINHLVSEYNQLALEREKLKTSVQESHPTLQLLNNQMQQGKRNILNTLNVYQTQLQMSLRQRTQQKNVTGTSFARLPEKEKILRSIERQQSIKENLFLILLEKQEEAAINFAVTAPSIKVVDYGLTSSKPVSPKKTVVYPVSLLVGLMLPFGLLFVLFSFDTKVHDRSDIEKLNSEIPVLAEIPFLEENKIMETDDRSILAESFRILSTNVNYLLPKKNTDEAHIVYVTSAIKGEGKTLIALNLSFAYASLKKRVLLLGADLRNPQLHAHVSVDKNRIGLSDYLSNSKVAWQDCIGSFGKNTFHKVCFSGAIPPNAPELLSSKGFEEFMDKAKKEFDYIIVDTAPTLLVTDTLLISPYADVTLFVTRAGFTEKRLLDFSMDLYKTKKLKNMAFVVNSIDQGKLKGYNYGYGYGYGAQKPSAPWYKDRVKRKG
ncbi:MAG: polysaccharide biosynthesis tyrosine autokinase [Saonia sp.]